MDAGRLWRSVRPGCLSEGSSCEMIVSDGNAMENDSDGFCRGVRE